MSELAPRNKLKVDHTAVSASLPTVADSDAVDVYAEIQREKTAALKKLYLSTELIVAPAELSDAAQILTLFTTAREYQVRGGYNAWKERSIKDALTEVKTGSYFLAKIGIEVAGMVNVSFRDVRYWDDTGTGEAAYVHKLAVSDKFRSQGIPQRLLDYAEQLAVRAGCKFIRLDTHPSPSLYRHYQKWGYRLHSRTILPDTGYHMTRWEKPLTPEAREEHLQGLTRISGDNER